MEREREKMRRELQGLHDKRNEERGDRDYHREKSVQAWEWGIDGDKWRE